MAEAIIEKKRAISPIWILPLLATLLGGWLLLKSFYEAGVEITLRVEDSSGITVDKTPVMLKGNEVGLVKDIKLRNDLQGVDLIIEMKKGTAPYLVEDMAFWVEKVDVRANRVSGLETLFSGNYIGVEPGQSTVPERNFVAHKKRPPVSKNAPGLHLKLHSDKFNSLDIGSGIFFQNVQIGSIQDYSLQVDSSVLIDIYIKPEYEKLVTKDTEFWNASGINITGGIADLKVHVPSLSSLLVGGINMRTPHNAQNPEQAVNGETFVLHSDLESLNAVNSPVGLHIVLEADDLSSISIGSGIHYRKVKVGEVIGTELSETFQKVLISAVIYEKFTPIVRENSRFWNSSGLSISGGMLSGLSITTESLQSLLGGGISLATPDNGAMGKPIPAGYKFTLESELDETWKQWSPNIKLGDEEVQDNATKQSNT